MNMVRATSDNICYAGHCFNNSAYVLKQLRQIWLLYLRTTIFRMKNDMHGNISICVSHVFELLLCIL